MECVLIVFTLCDHILSPPIPAAPIPLPSTTPPYSLVPFLFPCCFRFGWANSFYQDCLHERGPGVVYSRWGQGTLLQKTSLLSSSNCSLPIAPQTVVGSVNPFLLHKGMTPSLLLWVHERRSHVKPRCQSSTALHPFLWLLCSFCTLFYGVPWVLEGMMVRAKHTIVTHSQDFA